MFCLGCGAETPLGAAKCLVCGRETGGSTGDSRSESSVIAPLGTTFVPPPSPLSSQYLPPAQPFVTGGGSATGGPETLGLPRDTYGRIVLVTIIAMAVDLLVPWVVVDGAHRPIASAGAPVLVALPILGAALLPLLRPALRRKSAYAALPLITGALCAGAGGALWAVLTYLSYKLSIVAALASGTTGSPGVVISQDGAAFSLTPDVGIYLFILGGAVLIVAGYHVLLAEAGGMKYAAAPAPAGMALVYAPLPAPPALLPYIPPQAGIAAADAPTTVPLAATTSRPLSAARPGEMNGQASVPLLARPQQAVPLNSYQGNTPLQQVPAPHSATEHDSARAAPQNGSLRVPLPGSAEWNEAPRQPEHARPSLGWQRGPRVRR